MSQLRSFLEQHQMIDKQVAPTIEFPALEDFTNSKSCTRPVTEAVPIIRPRSRVGFLKHALVVYSASRSPCMSESAVR